MTVTVEDLFAALTSAAPAAPTPAEPAHEHRWVQYDKSRPAHCEDCHRHDWSEVSTEAATRGLRHCRDCRKVEAAPTAS